MIHIWTIYKLNIHLKLVKLHKLFMSKYTYTLLFICMQLRNLLLCTASSIVGRCILVGYDDGVTYYRCEKARIRETICNIRIIAGPDQGIKGIGGPKNFFHFYYTKTCKKYEILTISHFYVISQWSITCTIPLSRHTKASVKNQRDIT